MQFSLLLVQSHQDLQMQSKHQCECCAYASSLNVTFITLTYVMYVVAS